MFTLVLERDKKRGESRINISSLKKKAERLSLPSLQDRHKFEDIVNLHRDSYNRFRKYVLDPQSTIIIIIITFISIARIQLYSFQMRFTMLN